VLGVETTRRLQFTCRREHSVGGPCDGALVEGVLQWTLGQGVESTVLTAIWSPPLGHLAFCVAVSPPLMKSCQKGCISRLNLSWTIARGKAYQIGHQTESVGYCERRDFIERPHVVLLPWQSNLPFERHSKQCYLLGNTCYWVQCQCDSKAQLKHPV